MNVVKSRTDRSIANVITTLNRVFKEKKPYPTARSEGVSRCHDAEIFFMMLLFLNFPFQGKKIAPLIFSL